MGLLGKLYVRDNGQCQVGQKCSCENGIAVHGNKWWVMEQIDSDVIKILLLCA